MNKITNADLTPILSADDPEFRALVERFDPKCWAKYDLSAMYVGYHYGREPLLARIAALEEDRKENYDCWMKSLDRNAELLAEIKRLRVLQCLAG